jgi:hypothetical protein
LTTAATEEIAAPPCNALQSRARDDHQKRIDLARANMVSLGKQKGSIVKRRQFVGAGLALATTLPLRGFTAALGAAGDVPTRGLDG